MMRYALQWTRSLLFVGQIYLAMAVVGLLFFPWALFSDRGARMGARTWCRWVRWTAAWMVGLKSEIRGKVPSGELLIAAKHQSFFDIILLFGAVPSGKFIMKRELLFTPVLGQYATRMGCIPVNRGKRGAAISKMVADVKKSAEDHPGQLIIYPQGTRVPPGEKLPYKVGTAILYSQSGEPCVPVATNVGVFWPKRGIYRKPGTAVIEFLPVIEPGMPSKVFLAKIEADVEAASNRLMAEAGFHAED